jgi:hypothetical protein
MQECKNAIEHLKNQIQRNIEMIEVLENAQTDKPQFSTFRHEYRHKLANTLSRY